jgi:hypothetical protein
MALISAADGSDIPGSEIGSITVVRSSGRSTQSFPSPYSRPTRTTWLLTGRKFPTANNYRNWRPFTNYQRYIARSRAPIIAPVNDDWRAMFDHKSFTVLTSGGTLSPSFANIFDFVGIDTGLDQTRPEAVSPA